MISRYEQAILDFLNNSSELTLFCILNLATSSIQLSHGDSQPSAIDSSLNLVSHYNSFSKLNFKYFSRGYWTFSRFNIIQSLHNLNPNPFHVIASVNVVVKDYESCLTQSFLLSTTWFFISLLFIYVRPILLPLCHHICQYLHMEPI